MSYEPTEWKTGDVVTAAKLNKLEEGVAQGGGGGSDLFIVREENDPVSGKVCLDKTWQEIHDAIFSGANFVMQNNEKGGNTTTEFVDGVIEISYNGESGTPYTVGFGALQFYSDSLDGRLYEQTSQ